MNLFGKRAKNPKEASPFHWLNGESIYSYIETHLDPITGRLDAVSASALPDDDRRFATQRFRWAPGFYEGSMSITSTESDTNRTAALVIEVARKNSERAQKSLHEILLKDNVLAIIDPVIEQFQSFGVSAYPYLYDFVVSLAKYATDRGPIKFAIAMLGNIGSLKDVPLITLLGGHDEFTLYAAISLRNMIDQSDREIWALAKKVDGWGRIHAVRQLVDTETTSSEIKKWLLYNGYRNAIMLYELAYLCATVGDLKAALSADTIDDQLIDSAGEIIDAMITSRRADGDLDHYADGAAVVLSYLNHLEPRATKLEHFSVALTLWNYLTGEDWSDGEKRVQRQNNGWNDDNRRTASQTVQRILNAPHWKALIMQGLLIEDDAQFSLADRAANASDIDTRDTHWARLQANPLKSGCWFKVMQQANPANIDQIVDLALRVLPFNILAAGASDSLGLGPDFELHTCLVFIVQGLKSFPGKGWSILSAGLKSPVIGNRNMTLKVLASWGRTNWTPDIITALTQAKTVEPRADVKERIEKLLNGEPIS